MLTSLETIQSNLDRPIALIGMMGCGKTTLGKKLAEELGIPFYDSDRLIEEKAGMPTSEIFDSYGEAKFREVEQATICELTYKNTSVIATGGGAVTSPETLSTLKRATYVIWIDVSANDLWERLKNTKNRPLLMTENPRQRLEELLAARQSLYGQAHIHLKIDNQNHAKALEILINALADALNSAKR